MLMEANTVTVTVNSPVVRIFFICLGHESRLSFILTLPDLEIIDEQPKKALK